MERREQVTTAIFSPCFSTGQNSLRFADTGPTNSWTLKGGALIWHVRTDMLMEHQFSAVFNTERDGLVREINLDTQCFPCSSGITPLQIISAIHYDISVYGSDVMEFVAYFRNLGFHFRHLSYIT